MKTTVIKTGLRLVATVGMCVLLAASSGAAQSAADIEAMKAEIEALRLRQEALQKEIEALRAQMRASAAPAQPRTVVPTQPPPPIAPAPPLDNITLQLDRAPLRGDAAARVTLVEVSDFECPFCSRHFKQTSQLIEKDYVQSGRIRLAFLHFPLASHRNAFKAAEAGACAADQGKFWEMRDRLFSNQTQLLPVILPTHGTAVGVNIDTFRACLEGNMHAEKVRSDMTMAQRAGVTATPTFFIGTLDPKTMRLNVSQRIVGAKPYAAFQQALDAALARK
ncbi:MAG: thioredoxin domain-containing protein [Acidobacteria bacterium]|nr:thioredoxin domain-containing protein [Acidobacteriota bacterium]